MSESFLTFKKRILKEHLIKTTIIGVSAGLSIFGVLFLLIKREIIDLKIWALILISVGSILISSILYFIIRKPSDKKIAVRLDHTFNLNEKVQTMLDFKDEQENGIVILQREDTNHLLRSIKPKNLKFSFNILFFIILFIGFALSITSISVPKIVHNSPVTPPVEVPETDIDKIKKLIKHVESSGIYDDMKTKYITELNMLIVELQSDALTNELISNYVNATINNVLYYMTNKNINLKYGKILYDTQEVFYKPLMDTVEFDPAYIGVWKCQSDKDKEIKISRDKITYLGVDYEISSSTTSLLVGKITNNDTTTYVNLTLNKEDGTISDDNSVIFSKYEDFYRVRALGEGIYNYSISDIEKVIENINEEYESKKATSTFALRDKLDLDKTVYENFVNNNQADDEIYNALKALVSELNKASSASDKDKLTIIKDAYNKLYVSLADTIPDMLSNRDEAWYIEDTLREIFGLNPALRDKDLSHGGGNTGDSEGEGKEDFGSGGLGDGEYIFAAKDYFFDYDSGKWMAYGVFYHDYYAVIDSLIQDGTMSEEMAQYVKDYFNKLLNGLNEDTNE